MRDTSPLNRILSILSLTFCFTFSIKPQWDGDRILFRTSPSGGGRHPTEAYFFKFFGDQYQFYHINGVSRCLELFDQTVNSEIDDILALFMSRYNSIPEQLIILTSLFERNWFRYREPRTYRTVHMDAGHLAGSLEIVSGNLGIKAKTIYLPFDNMLERTLNESMYREGTLVAIGIYGMPL